MKFPSLLKTPSHRRFNIEPRYYDPVKEDIEQRTGRIKRTLKIKKMESKEGNTNIDSNIFGSFSRDSYYKKHGSGKLRFAILVGLTATVVGYFFLGNIALYVVMGLAIAFYLFRKFIKAG